MIFVVGSFHYDHDHPTHVVGHGRLAQAHISAAGQRACQAKHTLSCPYLNFYQSYIDNALEETRDCWTWKTLTPADDAITSARRIPRPFSRCYRALALSSTVLLMVVAS